MAESHRDEIAKLETLYASNPDGRVFTHLAEAYRRAGELDRAREILERGLRRHHDYASAHVVFGRVLADQGLESEAASSFRRVLELDAENLIARRALAESDRAAGRDADALVHYRELLAHDPSDDAIQQIVADLESRTQPAQPSTPVPSAWSGSQDMESWEPLAQEPLSIEGSSFGGTPAPAAGEPTEEPLSLDSVSFDAGAGLDLSTVDFGGGATPPPDAGLSLADFGLGTPGAGPAAAPDHPVEATPESTDEHGWGDWPGAVQQPSGQDAAAMEEPALSPETEPAQPTEAVRDAESAQPVEAVLAARPEAEPPARGEAATAPPGAAEAASLAEAEAASLAEAEAASLAEAEAGPAEEHPSAGAAADPALGVPTETLAALYRAQGFPDRAAAVYRALLRERPDDHDLHERARAAEAEAESLRQTRTGVDEARDVWVSGGADTWDADARVSTAHAWGEEESEADEAGPSISEYFQRVLSWRPAAPAQLAVATDASAAPVGPKESYEAQASSEPATAIESDPAIEGEATTQPEAPVEPAASVDSEAPLQPVGDEGLAAAGPFTFDGAPSAEQAFAPQEAAPASEPEHPADEPAVIPFVFGGEPRSDTPEEPLPYVFEAEEEEEDTAEPLPYVFETGAAEERSFEPPAPFTFDTEEEAPSFEEPVRFAFEAEYDPLDGVEESNEEPLPFVFEPELGQAEEEEEPLPFELDFVDGEDRTGIFEGAGDPGEEEVTPPYLVEEPADVDSAPRAEEPRTPDEWARLAETEGAAVEPWALTEDMGTGSEAPWAEPAAAQGTGEMLFLDEAEAVTEPPRGPAEDVGWDPTIALADVAPMRPRPPEARTGASTRPALPPPDEEEDDDLEMFRSWLQSLKK